MIIEVECPDCLGEGLEEDNKGREIPCTTCKGKGKIYEKEIYQNDEEANITDLLDTEKD